MRIKRETLSNFAFIIVLALLLFTPLGFQARVFVSRFFSFSPSELVEEEQQLLSNYHWKLNDIDGNELSFEDNKRKVILVNFWATWCPPCVAEMPSLHELYLDYHDKIAFVFITSDEKEKVRKFINKKAYAFPIYFENSPTPKVFSSDNIPTTYIIDASGKIRVKMTGAADWNSSATRKLLDALILKE